MTNSDHSLFVTNVNKVYSTAPFKQILLKMVSEENKDEKETQVITRDDMKQMAQIDILKRFICKVDVMFYVDEALFVTKTVLM